MRIQVTLGFGEIENRLMAQEHKSRPQAASNQNFGSATGNRTRVLRLRILHFTREDISSKPLIFRHLHQLLPAQLHRYFCCKELRIINNLEGRASQLRHSRRR